MTTGSATMTHAAATSWALIRFWPRKSYMPNMTGLRLFLVISR